MKNKANLDRRNFLKLAGVTGAINMAAGIIGWPDVQEINALMIDTPIYINTLPEDFYLAGG